MKFLHLNYYCHWEFSSPLEAIEKHRLSSGFVSFLRQKTDYVSVKHLNYEGQLLLDNIPYHFFRRRNNFWQIPFHTHRFIRRQAPAVILVEGFIFPLQLIFLRKALGNSCIIIVQHHAEAPWKGLKKIFQQWSDRYIDAYTFTAKENAKPWLKAKVIRDEKKCFEVLSASTALQAGNKTEIKKRMGWKGGFNFLWVGRLIDVKDPLTVVHAFAKYCLTNEDARLYMIFQDDDLLGEIKKIVAENKELETALVLVGKKDNAELADWYSAADYFISGSHREGSGYALVEAMTCGCYPVVTRIPSFCKITENGTYGSLYEAGDVQSLHAQLMNLSNREERPSPEEIIHYAKTHLSSEAICNQLLGVAHTLIKK